MKFWMSYWVYWEVRNILLVMHSISFISLCMAKIYVVDKCKNYLRIPMTGLFAWHVSIHDFGRYQFHQWNVLFQKMIWNIYHHKNQAWSERFEYFCCHALPWLILKKEIFQKVFYFLKVCRDYCLFLIRKFNYGNFDFNKPERVFGLQVRCRELDIFKIRNFLRNCLEIVWMY